MMTGRFAGAALALAMVVTGCSFGGEVDTPLDEEVVEVDRIVTATVPILAVRSVEMGRTRDGFLITAVGTAPGLGYSLPRLRARRGGEAGADGFIEYDFVAVEPRPEFELPPGTIQTRTVRADLPVTLEDLRGAAGLRVVALNGGVQMDF